MALTRDQWYEKLKSWIPTWFFEKEDVNAAVLKAFAKLLSTAEIEFKEDLMKQTYLSTATGNWLDLHGSERNIFREPGESDESYRERIRSVEFTIAYPNIKALVDNLLNNGECVLIENQAYGFADTDLFADAPDAAYLSKTKQYNRFTLLIPYQTILDDSMLKSIIVKALDDNKAVGVFYDIRYGGSAGTHTNTTSGQSSGSAS